jgi:ribokinase
MPDVVILGDINVDLLARVPFYPSQGGDSLAERLDVRAGGSAANTAVVLSKFGLEVSLIARVGTDIMAEYALSDLRLAGVDLSRVQEDAEARTGLIFAAVTPDGERTFFSCRGANAKTVLRPSDERKIGKARLLHVSGNALVDGPQREAALRAIGIADRAGVAVSLDLGTEVTSMPREGVARVLSMVSMVFLNRAVAGWLTGESDSPGSVDAVLGLGPGLVGLKLRDKGSLIGSRDGVFAVPAFPVEPMDETGAGDSFDAGLILGRIEGLSLRESALLANALGALATTVTGAGSALPGPHEALSLLENRTYRSDWDDWRAELQGVRDYLGRVA